MPQLLAFAALLLVLAIAPSQFSAFWPGAYDYLPQSLFSGLTAVAALVLALSPRPAARRSPIGWCLAAFFCWMLLAAHATVYAHDTILELARVGTALIWFWIARDLFKEQFHPRTAMALGAVTIGTLWIVALPILGFLKTRAPQLTGYFANNNWYANYCAMAFPFALSGAVVWRRAVSEKARPALLVAGLVVAVIVAVGLVVSASKGGLMALLAGSLAWLCIGLRARGTMLKEFVRARRGVVLALGLLFLFAASVVVIKTVGPRLLSARTSQNNSTMFRVYTWRATEKMLAERPVFGWGAASFPAVMARFSETGYTRTGHQSWLQLAAESGVPALLLLGAACTVALGNGWRAARSARWCEAAAGTGCLVALMVHGCVDAGWGTPSIVFLMMIAFALLDRAADNTAADNAGDETAASGPGELKEGAGSNLRLPWLGAVLLMGAAASLAQRAASGEDLALSSYAAGLRGETSESLRLSAAAVAADPLGARPRIYQAQARDAAHVDAEADWLAATRLRPTDAQIWRQWAQSRASLGRDAKEQFDRAVHLAPNDSRVLLTRGEWLLSKNDASGWKDLERIVTLLDAPYGRYPATPELNVDMDAVRALLKLARRDMEAKNPARARLWLKRVAPMMATAQSIAPQQKEMAKAMEGSGIGIQVPRDLDALAAELRELEAKL